MFEKLTYNLLYKISRLANSTDYSVEILIICSVIPPISKYLFYATIWLFDLCISKYLRLNNFVVV